MTTMLFSITSKQAQMGNYRITSGIQQAQMITCLYISIKINVPKFSLNFLGLFRQFLLYSDVFLILVIIEIIKILDALRVVSVHG